MLEQNDERELMRSYLLGGLARRQLEEVEVRLLSDARFRDALQLAQDELIDDYAFGVLSWRERWKFKRRFLLTPERTDKLRFARAVREYVDVAEQTEEGGAWSALRRRWLPRPAARRRLLVVASIAVCLLVAAAGLLLILRVRRSRSLQEHMARVEKVRAELGLEVERWTKQPPPDFPRSTPLAELTLTPSLARRSDGAGGARRIILTDAHLIAQIKLELSERRFESYDAALLTNEETVIFDVAGLRPENDGANRVLVIRIPAKSLTAGGYEFRLRGTTAAGEKGDAGRYPFQVTRRSASL